MSFMHRHQSSILATLLLLGVLHFSCTFLFGQSVIDQSQGGKPSNNYSTEFTPEEHAFLLTKKQINMCVDPDWMPLEKIENGKYVGMSADYMEIIEKKLGIPIVLVPTKDWTESMEYAKARKCDIFALAMVTPERSKYMDFSIPYLSFPLVLVTKNDQRFIADLTSLHDKTLGVVRGYAFGELLQKQYPQMHIDDVTSVNEGLEKVNRGNIYGFIGTLATASYAIQRGFPDELKIVGKFDEHWELGVATRNDQPQLLEIFNKIIRGIDRGQQQQILNRWISVKYERHFNYNWFWRILFVVVAAMAFLLYRNYTLGKYSHKLEQQNSEIQRQAQLLQETEKRLLLTQYAVDSCVYPILWIRNDPDPEQSKIIYANRAATEILGYSREELLCLGMDAIHLNLTPKDWKEVDPSHPKQTCHRRKDGTIFSLELYLSTFEYQDCSYSFAFFTDISRQKKMEEVLHRSMKMEAVGMMAGGVAHDLNNILSGIVSYPEFLLLGLPQESEFRKPLEMIHDSGKRAAEVVADMLTVTRGAAAVKEPANLNTLIISYFESPEYQDLIQHHGAVQCRRELAPELLNIACSTVHVKKCIMNLVANAVEAVGGHGEVSVSTRNLYMEKSPVDNQFMKKGEYVELVVSDNGKGIATTDLEHIFDPFYTKKAMGRSGTGLGLTVVMNTVQDHDGGISVNSDEGGSSFTLFFPAIREDVAEITGNQDLDEFMGEGEHILIVDDEVQQRDIASQMLRALNYNVSTAQSGEEALEYLREHQVDLLLLDMVMDPGINGCMTYGRAIILQPSLKAIIVSGFSENEEVVQAQELGAGQLVRKPYGLAEIGKAVQQELGRGRA